MSRTIKKSKPTGFECWGPRPSKGSREPNKWLKKFTHHRERRAATRQISIEAQEVFA